MTITGVDNNTNNSYICALILLKYEDNISFYKIFKYLNDMLCFYLTHRLFIYIFIKPLEILWLGKIYLRTAFFILFKI